MTIVMWVDTGSTIHLKQVLFSVHVCWSKSAMVCMGKSEVNLQGFFFWGGGASHPSCESQGPNLGGQGWQQVPSPA